MLTKKLYEGVKWRAAALHVCYRGWPCSLPGLCRCWSYKGAGRWQLAGCLPVLFIRSYLIFFFDQDTFKNKALKLVQTELGIVLGMIFMNSMAFAIYPEFITDANRLVLPTPRLDSPLHGHFYHKSWSPGSGEPLIWFLIQAVYSPQTLALLRRIAWTTSPALIPEFDPLLAMKNKTGWYMATTAVLAAVVSFQGFVVLKFNRVVARRYFIPRSVAILLIPAFNPANQKGEGWMYRAFCAKKPLESINVDFEYELA